MADVKHLVKEIYGEEDISPDRLRTILHDSGQLRRHRGWRAAGYLSLSAAAATFIFVSLDFYHDRTVRETVLQELAAGYHSNLDVEVDGKSYEELSQKLERVDFPLKPADEPVDHFYTVNGARYNTVGGTLAAQVELTNKIRHQTHTMYASRLTPDLAAVKPAFYEKNGVCIKVWQNRNMFYAIASPAAGR